MATLYVQAQPFQVGGAGVQAGGVTIPLQSFTDIYGVVLTMANFGTKGYITLEPGSGTQEEPAVFTGVTQNSDGTAELTGVSNVLTKSPYTETSGLSISHAGGTSIVVTNSAAFYNALCAKADAEVITGAWRFPNDASTPVLGTSYVAPTINTQVCSKGYADSLTFAGAPDATTTQKGIVELATQAELDARTATGGTGASLVPTPNIMRSVLMHDYAADAGATDSYAITCVPAVTAYTVGDVYEFKANTVNTGAATLNVNGLGAITIKKANGADLDTNDIRAGQVVQVVYAAGPIFQMQSLLGNEGASQAGVQNEAYSYAASSAGTDAYAITLTPAVTAYVAGQVFYFKTDVGNTGAATLNVSGLGAKTIVKKGGTALVTGDIGAGMMVQVEYDGTIMQMLSQTAQPATLSTISSNTTTQTIASDTALKTLATGTVLGGTLGTNNFVTIRAYFSAFGLANTKAIAIALNYGASTITTLNITNGSGGTYGGSTSGLYIEAVLSAAGTTNSQKGSVYASTQGGTGGVAINISSSINAWSGSNVGTLAIDSTVDQTISLTAQLNNSSANDLFTFQQSVISLSV